MGVNWGSTKFLWLALVEDPEDTKLHQEFERLLVPVLQAHQSQTSLPWKRIQHIEHALLTHRVKPSKRQQARFWNSAGIAYRGVQRHVSALEAFTFCKRMIEKDDIDTLFYVQQQLSEVTQLRGNEALAHASTAQIIEHLRHFAASLDATFALNTEPPPSFGMA